MTKVLIVYYSVHGSVEQLASQVARGVGSVKGCEAIVRTVPRVSENTKALDPQIPAQGAPYVSSEDLSQCDALILGSPTRFGNMAAAMKYFIDGTVNHWLSKELEGKPAAVFTSSSSMHGGQETTLLTMMCPLLHHGMILVGLPYSETSLNQTTRGGTPYGASHVTLGDNDAPLTEDEQILAKALGKRVARIALTLVQNSAKIAE